LYKLKTCQGTKGGEKGIAVIEVSGYLVKIKIMLILFKKRILLNRDLTAVVKYDIIMQVKVRLDHLSLRKYHLSPFLNFNNVSWFRC